MIRSYLPAIVFVVLGTIVGLAFTFLNTAFGPRRRIPAKTQPYECGLPSEVKRGFRFGISFYLVAMLFILFDVEAAFLLPWAVQYRSHLWTFWIMVGFVATLLVGYVYAWGKGALDWER